MFNSRKTRATPGNAPWVRILRVFLEDFGPRYTTWISSFGTPVYDLVTCWALRRPNVSLVVVGCPERSRSAFEAYSRHGLHPLPAALVSCVPGKSLCTRRQTMQCRDRLVAALSRRYLVLELRAGGTLEKALTAELNLLPRPVVMPDFSKTRRENAAHRRILRSFPRWVTLHPVEKRNAAPASSVRVRAKPEEGVPGAGSPVRNISPSNHSLRPETWRRFLFHYTRSWPGPWPGQPRCRWAEDLLADLPWAGHAAVDTLWRILEEKRLRASGRLIRGKIPVVSWTSVPPHELERISRWNPALIRWTFEPYGIAVSKKILKQRGARPALYVSPRHYHRIPPEERYRYQAHEAGKKDWKMEREWRTAGDFYLEDTARDEWWAFVAKATDAERIRRLIRDPPRIWILETGEFM